MAESEGDSDNYLEQLRLQNIDLLDRGKLVSYANRWGKPKLERAADRIISILDREEDNAL